MANSSQSSQTISAPAGARSANQTLVVAFERDESLAGTLLGQLRAQGYEGRAARTPVEVFDLIARYPVGLVLVNLGQAATGRREFWVALDAQRRGRGVQVVTYRYILPGMEPEAPDGSGRGALADVEIHSPQGFGALVESVQMRLPLPPRQLPGSPGSDFLLNETPPTIATNRGQPGPGTPQGYHEMPATMNLTDPAARHPIAGVLNLSAGPLPAGQPREFMPPPAPGMQVGEPANAGWAPQVSGMPMPAGGQPVVGAMEQRGGPWVVERAAIPGAPDFAAPPGRPGAALPGNAEMNAAPPYNNTTGMRGAPAIPGQQMGGQQGNAGGVNPFAQGIYNAPMPMGDLVGLTDAIHALAAAGAPGYTHAAAAANAMNQAMMSSDNEAARRIRGAERASQDAATMNGWGMGRPEPATGPAMMNEGRSPSGQMPGMNQMMGAGQAGGRNPAETLYLGPQDVEELRQAQGMGQPQDTRSRALAGGGEEFEAMQRSTSRAVQSSDEETLYSGGRRLADGGQMAGRQNQMLAPVPAATYVERSLGNVLVEGQLVSQQRLEVALGIQRLLRGVDIDYRLGEVLLLFKFLTPDQLLAALLVSRGLVTPAQVAAMGRIKQELHAIGMEYDLENLLILFRLLSSEQLREVRSESR